MTRVEKLKLYESSRKIVIDGMRDSTFYSNKFKSLLLEKDEKQKKVIDIMNQLDKTIVREDEWSNIHDIREKIKTETISLIKNERIEPSKLV